MDIHPVAPATLATATAAVTATTSAGTPTRVILLAGLLLAGCRTDGTVPGPPASTAAPPPVAASTAGATTPVAGPGTAAPLGAATELVDDSGRTVRLPAVIRRVYPAGPPAMVLVYVVARDALVGWPQELPAGAEAFIPAPYWQLPRLGRLTGRGGTANIEAVLAARPDLVVDYGTVDATTRSLAERVQAQLGVPYVLLDGSFEGMPAVLRTTGRLLGAAERGARLAEEAERILAEARRSREAIPRTSWPKVYLARGPLGLETGGPGCINAEVLDRLPVVNVAGEGLRRAGLFTVSPEDLLRWQPQLVLTAERSSYHAIRSDERWTGVEAVRRGSVVLAPVLPFGWIDQPPSINRLLGLQLLASGLGQTGQPARAVDELRGRLAGLFQLLYQHAPSEAELEALLAAPLAPKDAWR